MAKVTSNLNQPISTLPSGAVLSDHLYSPFDVEVSPKNKITSFKIAVAHGASQPSEYSINPNFNYKGKSIIYAFVVNVDYADTDPTHVDIYTFSEINNISIGHNTYPISYAVNDSEVGNNGAETSKGTEVAFSKPPTEKILN
ncbi:hypothetical protein [Tenacibaculum aiptasiae]|uniref:hypothetical protein n=1 Tax=Tenacibaculum aiptasiae TaxID=426481 RepID=UPI003B5A8A7A